MYCPLVDWAIISKLSLQKKKVVEFKREFLAGKTAHELEYIPNQEKVKHWELIFFILKKWSKMIYEMMHGMEKVEIIFFPCS